MQKQITQLEMIVINLLGNLSLRDMEILRLRFIENMNLRQVGAYYNMSAERIRQLEDRSLRHVAEVVRDVIQATTK